MKNKLKYMGIIIGVLFLIWQLYGIIIDFYNFKQLEKVKIIFNSINKSTHFSSLDEFNNIYKADIKSIKNCYYISSNNGKEKYIFGFKLESLIYIWDKVLFLS